MPFSSAEFFLLSSEYNVSKEGKKVFKQTSESRTMSLLSMTDLPYVDFVGFPQIGGMNSLNNSKSTCFLR